jgi:hypothetical protein
MIWHRCGIYNNMNWHITHKEVSMIIGVLVALIIVFGMWISGAQQELSALPDSGTSFPEIGINVGTLIKSISFRF